MTRAEEYRLSQYQHLGALREDKSIDLVRDQQTGLIGVQKVISSELYPVYLFLKEHTNPYLPVIYECIQLDENRLLIIEEYETGKNLEECLESGMKFSEAEAAGMIRDLCMALQPLHDAKPPIICRDLKTENVMLTADHRIKLIDFDIARQYQPGKHRDTVMMVSYSENEGSEYNKPTDGNEYVMVEFEIVNNSENEITVSSALSFDGYADDYALNYSFAAMVENETSNQLDGTIAPGKKMDGMVGFEVPKDWKTMEIHFKDDVWSNSKFKFEIEK